MDYASNRRADAPLLTKATAALTSTFVTLLGCLVAVAFLLTPWAAVFGDLPMIQLGWCRIPGYVRGDSHNNAPPACVLQWNYHCEKSVSNGTLSYSMSCTSSSSSEQFGVADCSFSEFSSEVSEADMRELMVNASCRVADAPFPVTTPSTKKSETWKVVVCLTVFAVFAFFHVRLGCQLLRRWCLRRCIPEHQYDMVSRLRYHLVMESFAKYFLLASLTVVFLLATLYHRLTCRLDYMYWFAVSLVCMIAQIYTVVVIEDLKFFEELPDSAFENGRIDRENIKQIREQKAKDRNRVYREERQRNCSACKDKCRICFRPLPPPP